MELSIPKRRVKRRRGLSKPAEISACNRLTGVDSRFRHFISSLSTPELTLIISHPSLSSPSSFTTTISSEAEDKKIDSGISTTGSTWPELLVCEDLKERVTLLLS